MKEQESVDEMIAAAGRKFKARADALNKEADGMKAAHDTTGERKTRASAEKYGGYANYCLGKGIMPVDSSDPEFMMRFGPTVRAAVEAQKYERV